MLQTIYGIFILLHGLVHMWYVTLAQGWVPFEPEMGWTGNSWLFTNVVGDMATRTAATVVYSLVTIAFVIVSIGVFANTEWWPTALVTAALTSSIGIILFWDGSTHLLVQKGLLGLFLNFALLILLFIFNWPGNQA